MRHQLRATLEYESQVDKSERVTTKDVALIWTISGSGLLWLALMVFGGATGWTAAVVAWLIR